MGVEQVFEGLFCLGYGREKTAVRKLPTARVAPMVMGPLGN